MTDASRCQGPANVADRQSALPGVAGTRVPSVLAISSGGGHWVQLLRASDAWNGCIVTYATVSEIYAQDLPAASRLAIVPDATRWSRWQMLKLAWTIGRLLVSLRPDVIVTTGAAPGYLAVRLGKLLGARTVWIDSIANVDAMSMSGSRVRRHADLWLTQWPHLAGPSGPQYLGSVL